jgi:hypothetical protein
MTLKRTRRILYAIPEMQCVVRTKLDIYIFIDDEVNQFQCPIIINIIYYSLSHYSFSIGRDY